MDVDLIQASQTLVRGHTVRILDDPGGSVLVVRGHVWFTRLADPEDYVLGACESFVLDERSGVVATALEDSAIALLNAPGGSASPVRGHIDPQSFDAYRRRAEALRSRYRARSLSSLPRLVVNALRELGVWYRGADSEAHVAALKTPYF